MNTELFYDENGTRVYKIVRKLNKKDVQNILRKIYYTKHNAQREKLRGVLHPGIDIVYAVEVKRAKNAQNEYHIVTSNGGDLIFQDSKWVQGKFSIVTCMYLRVAQLRRLFSNGNAPKELVRTCRHNQNNLPHLFY